MPGLFANLPLLDPVSRREPANFRCRGSLDFASEPPAPLTPAQARLALHTYRHLLSWFDLERISDGRQPSVTGRLTLVAHLPLPLSYQ